MSLFDIIYNLLIGPLELFFEIVFVFAYRIIGNAGLSLILLSLVINFLVLPLYKQADAMQAEERDTEEKLKHWVDHIKKTFKGDERFMMLQTYYRQNNYKPTDALKGSLSLLLEVPFFMAAYNFLSGLEMLNGVSFGPIKNLGAPDAMLVIGGMAINVLPILMTVINIISGIIYTKGFPAKAKIQLYGMALIFLVLLYNSPAGLVFYWTLNNLFSLAKNIFLKQKNPQLSLSIISCLTGVAIFAYSFINPFDSMKKQVFVLAIAVLLQLPLVWYFAKKRLTFKNVESVSKQDNFLFFTSCAFMAVLTGIFIPSSVIKASPVEFVNLSTLTSPVSYLISSLRIACGIFVVWFSIFYMLANPRAKKIISCVMSMLAICSVANYMFFGTDYGNLSPQLTYDNTPVLSIKTALINFAVIAIVCVVIFFIWSKQKELLKVVFLSAVIAMGGMSLFNTNTIKSTANEAITKYGQSYEKPVLNLSKNGKNVIVLMLDRAIGSHIPYIMQEKPELIEKFDGFTFYPNTISYGPATNVGSPGLFGGYEYIPEEMNKRVDEPLSEKHNESLKVMPVLFDNAGFDVTVCDPTYANYAWVPDLTIYDEYPDIDTYISKGKFDIFSEERAARTDDLLRRNLFCYSIFRIAPVAAHTTLYSTGLYNEANILYPSAETSEDQYKFMSQVCDTLSTAKGSQRFFYESYSVLENLPNMTNIKNNDTGTFLLMTNDTTHEPTLLQKPNYTPAFVVDNTGLDDDYADGYVVDGRKMNMYNVDQVTHYHVNMAAMLKLGEYFDYLRENGVYDNTRIIIVSDHGRFTWQFDDMVSNDGQEDMLAYNPLLMVKDFNSTGFTTDNTFMTNADVPTLATNDVVNNPTNPFTNKPINSDHKNEDVQLVLASHKWDTATNNGNTFLPDNWYALKNHNMFDMNNWELISENQ